MNTLINTMFAFAFPSMFIAFLVWLAIAKEPELTSLSEVEYEYYGECSLCGEHYDKLETSSDICIDCYMESMEYDEVELVYGREVYVDDVYSETMESLQAAVCAYSSDGDVPF